MRHYIWSLTSLNRRACLSGTAGRQTLSTFPSLSNQRSVSNIQTQEYINFANGSQIMSQNGEVNLLSATAGDLHAGEVTSVKLVQLYLAQIAAHNHGGLKLNAIIATAPIDKVLEEAKALDEERRTTGPRSKLHGIPIILKANPFSPRPFASLIANSCLFCNRTSSPRLRLAWARPLDPMRCRAWSQRRTLRSPCS